MERETHSEVLDMNWEALSGSSMGPDHATNEMGDSKW